MPNIARKRLEEFARTRYDDCLKMAIKYSNSRADAEDAVQDAFVNAVEHLDTYNVDMPFDRWFIRVLINACFKQIKKPFRSKEVSFTTVEHYLPNLDISILEQKDFDTLLVEKIDSDYRRRILYEAMRSLGESQLDLLILKYGHDTPSETISVWYGISTVAVDCRLTRIKHTLRKRVEEISKEDLK